MRRFLITLLCLVPWLAQAQLESTSDLQRGLVGWWRFNEGTGTNAFDLSGNANTGTLSGSTLPVWINGVFGGALNFGGSSGCSVACGNPASLQIQNKLTVGCWFKFSGSELNAPLVAKWGTDQAYVLLVSPSSVGKLSFSIRVSEVTKIAETASTYNDSKWHFVCGIFNGTNVLINVDGGKEAVTGDATSGPIDNPPTGVNFTLGAYDSALGMFIGFIDDVRIYNRALSATEVLNLYCQGGGRTP